MSKITALIAQKKNKDRCNLYLDDVFYSGVSSETIMKNRLKVGDEIDESKLGELIIESEKNSALSKSIEYISKTQKTKKQVKDYLISKGFSEEIAWFCIDKLKEYNYVNDIDYSKKYSEAMCKTHGKRLLEYKLMQKGIRKEDIEKGFFDADIDMKKMANELAKKYLRNKEITKENLLKTFKYLLGRGYSYEEASSAISSFGDIGD